MGKYRKPDIETMKAVLSQLIGKEVEIQVFITPSEETPNLGYKLTTGVLQITFGSKYYGYTLVAEGENVKVDIGNVVDVRLCVVDEGEFKAHIVMNLP